MSTTHLLAAWTETSEGDPRVAITDASGEHTYGAIRAQARAIAAALPKTSNREERTGILVSPGASFVTSLVGAWLSGACVVVLSPLHPAPETTYFIEDARVTT
ncbi:MAG: AMP-binding protein, partial [Polyangiaceae bacterium]